MFFILSKITAFLLTPGFWILALLVAGLITKKNSIRRKNLLIASAVLFLIFSNPLLLRTCIYNWQINEPTTKKNVTYNAGILLSGLVSFDKEEKGFFQISSDRYIQTLQLYDQGVIKKILISGGSGSVMRPQLNEAAFLKQQFIINNVPDSNVIIDAFSRNTSENIQYSKKILDSLHISPPYVLITSAMHLRRAAAICRKQGLDADLHPANYNVIEMKFEWEDLLPRFKVISDWNPFIREVIGLAVYKMTGRA